ncbi:MAG: cysteine--tRNA ligase [Planctomycetota bacterium]|nr:cysteine--tRNA ligase [Planctomycetota bacterium]
MTSFQIHDTLSRTLRHFEPSKRGGPILFYSCGPTVYDDAHIGNFRSFLNADLMRRALEFAGHNVLHVMNITDVGHMTEDHQADGGGEDKMAVAGRRIAEAKKSGAIPEGAEIDPNDPFAIADFYAARFLDDARTLGLKVAQEAKDNPALMPRPTRCIGQMIDLVSKLIDRQHAYVASDGVVYFDVRSFDSYGALSGNTLDALREGEGGRISAQHQSVKRHPADFMLWKPDPKHIMRWNSPWGEGYPGWHLECSAMAAMCLGEEIDLHSGGEDNIFPHHECEIAQSCCGFGRSTFSRYWMHTRHLIVEGEKMSKRKGNFYTARDLFQQGISPGALRLELVRTNYRLNSNFTMQGVQDCQRQIDRWERAGRTLAEQARIPWSGASDLTGFADATSLAASGDPSATAGPLERALESFGSAIGDDLNLSRAIAALNAASSAKSENADPKRELAALIRMDAVLGVLSRSTPLARVASADDQVFNTKVESLIAARAEARRTKDWAQGDRLRDELTAMGVVVKDDPTGATWTRG